MLFSALAIPVFALLSVVKGDAAIASSSTWAGYGGGPLNQRWASQNRDISSFNIRTLSDHCQPVQYPGGGISATPVVSGNAVYYPTWGGTLVAFDYTKCRTLWTLNVSEVITSFSPLTPIQISSVAAAASRTSPQIDGNVLYFGTLANALMVAVNVNTGKVLSTIQVDSHPVALITMSPTVYDGKIFVGVSSAEENAASLAGYVCCSFVGRVVGLSFDKVHNKFSFLWNIPVIPSAQAKAGWAGVAVWGSQPSIDAGRRQVFFGTGNAYIIPEIIQQCQNETASIPAVAQGLVPDPCLPRDIWQESVIAVDIDQGVVNWVHQLPALDSWTIACLTGDFANCPETPGPDADFGMAPTFVPGSANTPYGKDTLVLGQKNGNLHAISAQSGELFWVTMTNPGGIGGGLSWGLAADDTRVYFTAINSGAEPFTLEPSGAKTNGSGYGAASLKDGSLLWEVKVPGETLTYGPPSVVGDLVLVANTGGNDSQLVALDKTNGNILDTWTVKGGSFRGGVTIQDETVMFGTGYGGFAGALTPGILSVKTVR